MLKKILKIRGVILSNFDIFVLVGPLFVYSTD
jgi:hypothetical protein